jgi:hypothetical protein
MHYAYDVPVYPANRVDNHVEIPVKLSAGIVKHVTIRFPPGCARMVNCTIWDSSEQLFPTNMESVYCEDSYAVEIDCYLPTWLFGNDFAILAWNTGTNYLHILRVLIAVQSVGTPDEAETVKTLNKTIDSLVTVLKGFY